MEQYVIVAMRGRNIVEGKRKDYNGAPTIQRLEMNINDESNCLTGVQKDNLVIQINPSTESNGKQPYQQNRVYDTDGILPALPAQMSSGTHAIQLKQEDITIQSELLRGNIRRLTPIETERLQGFDDNHTEYGCYPVFKLKRKEGDVRKNVSDQELFNELSNEDKINHFNQTIVKEIPQTQRYKMCGNAVNVATAKLVTDKLFDIF